MKAKSFTDLYREAERHDDYWVAHAAHGFLEDLVRAMEEAGISRAELARRLGSSPAYVTKILRGNVNFSGDGASLVVSSLSTASFNGFVSFGGLLPSDNYISPVTTITSPHDAVRL